MAQEKFLSLNAMEKIMKQAGAPRVAESAKEALAEVLEEKAKEISLEAKKYAEHAGRRTVTADDIKLAVKQ
ncbi:NFYB/HAP3 family transcription factor subunit [Candidatus Woesearchaeota archaeon]|nr:NFYB/HAP3 family transcription factor subunit [Candidatus Woesearchaeota archaeon]